MADTVILHAVVSLAVAVLPLFLLLALNLLRSDLDSFLTVIVLTAIALANGWITLDTSLEADTVQLATVTSLAVAATRR